MLTHLDRNLILKCIVTVNETWIHRRDHETAKHAMETCHISKPRKFKLQASSSKIMCTIFWDAKSVLLIDFMPDKVTVTELYNADLLHKLYVAIKKEKHPYFGMTMHLLTGHLLDKLPYFT